MISCPMKSQIHSARETLRLCTQQMHKFVQSLWTHMSTISSNTQAHTPPRAWWAWFPPEPESNQMHQGICLAVSCMSVAQV